MQALAARWHVVMEKQRSTDTCETGWASSTPSKMTALCGTATHTWWQIFNADATEASAKLEHQSVLCHRLVHVLAHETGTR